jgi:hypothetical protein
MDLRPLAATEIDPRITPHLAPGETVLWQTRPKPGTFFGPSQIGGALALIALGIVLASGLIVSFPRGPSTYGPAAAAVGVGILLLVTRWNKRADLWSYAITDRRLLSVLKNTVIRSLTPEELDIYKLRISGDTVYWLKMASNDRGMGLGVQRGADGFLVGFRGQTDPQATKALIERWRQGISERASNSAAAFVETMAAASGATGGEAAAAPPPGVRRVTHPGTGLTLDVLPDWKVTVRTRYDGPLRIFGIQILPRIIRDGPDRPYGDGGDWNYLSVSGAPEAGLELTIHDRPLDTTLDAVLNDPFTKLTGTQILDTDPNLQIGPFKGFSVIRQMPAALQIKNGPELSGPSMLRQIWLSRGDRSLELQGYALASQPDVQRAIDAMVGSISVRG